MEKRYKRRSNQKNLDLGREISIHREVANHIEKTMASMGVGVPKLLEATARYIMEQVDTSCPLTSEDVWDTFSPSKQKEIEWRVRIFIKSCAAMGIFLRDVEAYYNAKEDKVIFLDFGQAYKAEPSLQFKIESGALLPASIMERLRDVKAHTDE